MYFPGGVLASWGQDPQASVSAFQVSVGQAGTSNKTVKLPKNFTLLGPGPGYTCGPAKIVPSTKFFTPDLRRKTQALSKSRSSNRLGSGFAYSTFGITGVIFRCWYEGKVIFLGKHFQKIRHLRPCDCKRVLENH